MRQELALLRIIQQRQTGVDLFRHPNPVQSGSFWTFIYEIQQQASVISGCTIAYIPVIQNASRYAPTCSSRITASPRLENSDAEHMAKPITRFTLISSSSGLWSTRCHDRLLNHVVASQQRHRQQWRRWILATMHFDGSMPDSACCDDSQHRSHCFGSRILATMPLRSTSDVSVSRGRCRFPVAGHWRDSVQTSIVHASFRGTEPMAVPNLRRRLRMADVVHEAHDRYLETIAEAGVDQRDCSWLLFDSIFGLLDVDEEQRE